MTAPQSADVPSADVPSADVKVLFLAGKGRSGGTLLAALLGQLPGFFNIGELNRLWDWGLVAESKRFGAAASDYQCGCGEPLRTCPTWRAILERADELAPQLAPLAQARIDEDQAAVVRWSQAARLLRARPGGQSGWPALDRYTAASSAVYRAITDVTGARVVIDSSRLPIEPVGLGLVPGVDVHVTQLVRDPRAVVYSWKRRKRTTDYSDDEYMPRFSASYTTTSWLVRNAVTELIGRRRPVEVVQYDELARDPAAVLRRLAAVTGEPAGDLAFLTSETATIAPTHSVGGNPMRMTSGAITIEPDDEWRSRIEPRDRLVATTIALPLLHHYGLPVRSTNRASDEPPASTAAATRSAVPTLTTNAWLRFDAIRHGLRVAQPRTVLEIGTGEGALGSWLARRYDYTGVELDDRSRATAESRIAAEGLGDIRAGLDDVGDEVFDLVCSFEVLEHIADDEQALKQWHDLVRPSGWLLLSVPAHTADSGAADELVGHYRRYERDALRDQLHGAGFEVVRFSSYGAGLGHVLQRVRNTLAARRLAQQRQEGDTPEERSSGSGRLFQPTRTAAALACATVAAPARLVQAPFAGTDVGTGYVVLARRAG
jgi:cyclopropane fatty-acyl-phospholipid synthase-like methyltransferase